MHFHALLGLDVKGERKQLRPRRGSAYAEIKHVYHIVTAAAVVVVVLVAEVAVASPSSPAVLDRFAAGPSATESRLFACVAAGIEAEAVAAEDIEASLMPVRI